jgi:hypothetical protein
MNNILSRFFSHQPSKSDEATPTIVEKAKLAVPEDSMLRRHFLTQLRTQIETELFPNVANDASLKHYYEASIAAEFQKRLAG